MTRCSDKRGFAMLIVILLMLIVGATGAMMLARADAQSRSVKRQVDGYQVYHGVRGIQTTFKAWQDTQRNARNLNEILDPDGLAFVIDPSDGTELRIYLFDAQGLLRTETQGVPAESAAYLEQAVRDLEREVGPLRMIQYGRSVGPWTLSINGAPTTVVRALAGAVAGASKGEQLASAIEALVQEEEPVDREALNEAMTDAGLSAEERTQFNAMVTVEPTLWELVVDMRGSGASAGQGLLARYRALTVFAPVTGNSTPVYERPPPFLSWEKEEVEPYSRRAPISRVPLR